MFLLYIDPGTGSMLFSVLLGIAATLIFSARALILKLKFVVSRGKQTELDKTHLPIVIFTDSKRYWNLFKPICDEFESRKVPLVYYTQDEDDPAFTENYNFVKREFIGSGNKAFAKMNMLNADICLATTPGLDVYQWKRSKNVKYYVHIPHSIDEMLGYRMYGIDYFDSILLTGDFQKKYIRKLEEIRKLPAKELVTVGYPVMDEAQKKLNATTSTQQKDENKKFTLLVAPGWGQSAILSRYGSSFLKALKATGFNVVMRPHPQTKISEAQMLEKLIKEFPNEQNFTWNFDNNNFECMANADILITDFSGIIFEFALLFDKPLIYADTHFDNSVYDAAWIKDEPLWRFEVLKKLGIQLNEKDFSNMKEIIEQTAKNNTFANGRKEVKEEAWQNRGKSVSTIVDYLIKKEESLVGETND